MEHQVCVAVLLWHKMQCGLSVACWTELFTAMPLHDQHKHHRTIIRHHSYQHHLLNASWLASRSPSFGVVVVVVVVVVAVVVAVVVGGGGGGRGGGGGAAAAAAAAAAPAAIGAAVMAAVVLLLCSSSACQ